MKHVFVIFRSPKTYLQTKTTGGGRLKTSPCKPIARNIDGGEESSSPVKALLPGIDATSKRDASRRRFDTPITTRIHFHAALSKTDIPVSLSGRCDFFTAAIGCAAAYSVARNLWTVSDSAGSDSGMFLVPRQRESRYSPRRD